MMHEFGPITFHRGWGYTVRICETQTKQVTKCPQVLSLSCGWIGKNIYSFYRIAPG